MSRRILIIQGHPDSAEPHFCHALASAYAQGAQVGGHETRTVDVAALDFPLLRSQREWEHGELPASLREAQQGIGWTPPRQRRDPGKRVGPPPLDRIAGRTHHKLLGKS